MTRRELIAGLTVAAFGAPKTMSVGMQTNAWKLAPDDVPGLLKVLAEIKTLGYEGFETSYRNVQDGFGKKSKEVRAQLAETGLRFIGCHLRLGNYEAKTNIAPTEQIESIGEGAAALGAERLILSGAPVRDDEASVMDPQRLLWKAGALNRAGRNAALGKMRVCYHNHAAEFQHEGEEITALMKETDGDVVRFIIDVPDAIRMKADMGAFFAKYHKKIDGLHVRDFEALSYESLAMAVRKAKWTGWVIAEEEQAKAAGPAREKIRAVFGV